jgi:hypothetical protein
MSEIAEQINTSGLQTQEERVRWAIEHMPFLVPALYDESTNTYNLSKRLCIQRLYEFIVLHAPIFKERWCNNPSVVEYAKQILIPNTVIKYVSDNKTCEIKTAKVYNYIPNTNHLICDSIQKNGAAQRCAVALIQIISCERATVEVSQQDMMKRNLHLVYATDVNYQSLLKSIDGFVKYCIPSTTFDHLKSITSHLYTHELDFKRGWKHSFAYHELYTQIVKKIDKIKPTSMNRSDFERLFYEFWRLAMITELAQEKYIDKTWSREEIENQQQTVRNEVEAFITINKMKQIQMKENTLIVPQILVIINIDKTTTYHMMMNDTKIDGIKTIDVLINSLVKIFQNTVKRGNSVTKSQWRRVLQSYCGSGVVMHRHNAATSFVLSQLQYTIPIIRLYPNQCEITFPSTPFSANIQSLIDTEPIIVQDVLTY